MVTNKDSQLKATEIKCKFSEIPSETMFYIKRYEDGCSADSIGFWKACASDTNAENFEFGLIDFNPDQQSNYYI